MRLLVIAGVCAALGCQSLATDAPARLVNQESVARVSKYLSEAYATSIVLADDAFLTSSTLVLENKRSGSLQYPSATGRDLSEPRRLTLVRNGKNCFVIDAQSDRRISLPGVECLPE